MLHAQANHDVTRIWVDGNNAIWFRLQHHARRVHSSELDFLDAAAWRGTCVPERVVLNSSGGAKKFDTIQIVVGGILKQVNPIQVRVVSPMIR